MRKFLIAALLAPLVCGQTPVTRTYTFTHVDTVQEFQEIASVMRVITGIGPVTTDNTQKKLTVTGATDQIGVTDWLFQQLDQPPQGQASVTYNVSKDDVVQLFYLPSTKTIQDFQETANGVRTLVEIKLAFTVNAQRAFLIRGAPAQLAHAAWMIGDLTQPTHGSGAHQYQRADDDVTQIFYLTHTASVQDFQETANMIRSIAEIRRTIAENTPRALIVRGTSAQIAIAAWLVSDLDQAQPAPAALHEYHVAGDDTIRVFYLPATTTVQDFQATANRVRTSAKIRQAVATNAKRAFTVRGTSAQIAQAEQMLQQ
jgi:type II secretory pathway component GspD/PulD (secretin)